jgi:hypothetical protein
MYLDDIASLLLNETVMINDYNDKNDNIVCLIPYGSGEPDITFEKNIIRYPKFQAYIRDTVFTTAWSRAETILSTLKGYTNSSMSIIPISDIISGGKDEKDRNILYLNFKINKVS